MTKDKRLVFVHIPKTAGSSLNLFIYQNYSRDECILVSNPNETPQINEHIKCILGHNLYGQHQELGPCHYITMFRDPINRVISNYFYLKEVLHYNHLGSLEEFAQSAERSNLQTRFVTGGEANLEQAIINLDHFTFYGVTEVFQPSLFLLKEIMGWKNMNCPKVNVNKKKPTKELIPQETIKKIEQANQLDIQLYQVVKKNFDNRLQSLDHNMKIELQKWTD
ncbi:sulfotransferase family 2 domain-containing protein [Bacillus sp. WMMC1349]|uniref:sulfotransferase family 2 domain-containing protein n=1 Tax=Bacillus sp. WMMC1349 TaxID=2736254 RepID=UPI0015576950|nr:sulfotransferase family 2 domain-containing protein [Bacillus sp. WMMC1349]NPC92885.1 sulfotransferase family 2 domain-containing protein [Bacillus sp. WMMC1349]